jgi:hypothetical protein
MRKIAIFLFLLFPATALAAVEGRLSTHVWYVDTEVMITGTDLLGPNPSKSKICFAPEANKDDLRCFLSTHPNVTTWGSTVITVIPPKNAPPIGMVILVHPYSEMKCEYLYNKNVCQAQIIKNSYEIGAYKASPYVTQVTHMASGEPAKSLEVNQIYQIDGYRFGDSGFGIYVGLRLIDKTDIILWTHDTIRLRLSKPPEDPTGIQVHNGAGKSNVWVLGAGQGSGTTVQTRARGTVTVGSSSASSPEHTPPVVTSSTGRATQSGTTGLLQHGGPFTDVPPGHSYAPAITWAKASGFLTGYADGSFLPDQAVTRAELLKILFVHEPTIKSGALLPKSGMWDVNPNEWYAPYIRFAVAKGIVQGYPDKSFRPNQSVTVGEALKILYRSMAVPTLDPRGTQWYSRYYEHAQSKGILYDDALSPTAPMSRADTVWAVWQILKFHGLIL